MSGSNGKFRGWRPWNFMSRNKVKNRRGNKREVKVDDGRQ